MKYRTFIIASIAILSVGFIYITSVIPTLNDEIPSSISIDGRVLSHSSKYILYVFEVIPLLLFIGITVMNHIFNNKGVIRKNSELSYSLVFCLVAFLTYVAIMYTRVVSKDLYEELSRYVVMGLGGLSISIGIIIPSINQSKSIGFRNHKTLSSRVLWLKTHKLAGKSYIVSGSLTVLLGAFKLDNYELIGILVLLTGGLLVPYIYSYMAEEAKEV